LEKEEMMKQRSASLTNYLLIITILLSALGLAPVLAAPAVKEITCAEEYTIQADDWLSKIADKLLGDVLAFPAIVAATHQKQAADATFAQITNPDLIEPGWKLCIPGPEDAQALLATTSAAPAIEATMAPLEPANLTVFAAASLTDAFNEIGQNFSAEHPGVTITFNFAGSQQLAQQLAQGAPADLFASANRRQMEMAILEAQRVISGTEQTFVHNRLVVIYPADNPAGITQLQDLAKPGVKLILAAQEVPVGQYSLDFLGKAVQDLAFGATFKDDVLKNVVSYEENVRSVLTKVALGEGDAGIVYTSDISGDGADQVGRMDIPDALNTIASYPIAIVNDSAYPAQAQALMDYILSPAAQAVLANYGFIPQIEIK
jgi:molybdate transport system substrate-binding protein